MRGSAALRAALAVVGLCRFMGLGGCATAGPVPEPPDPSVPDPGLAVAQLVELEHARADALTQGDVFSLERLLEEGYRGLTAEGVRRTKGQEVERLRAEGARAVRRDALVSDELEVRSYGPLAVVTGRGNVEGPKGDRPYQAIRFTHVWLWREGRWQLVSSHESTRPSE